MKTLSHPKKLEKKGKTWEMATLPVIINIQWTNKSLGLQYVLTKKCPHSLDTPAQRPDMRHNLKERARNR